MLVWNKAPRLYRGDGRALAWILQLAKNRAIDEVRSRRSRQDRLTSSYDIIQDQPILKQFSEDNHTPEVALSAKETDAEVLRALKLLKPRERRVWELVLLNGMTRKQAAQEMDIPLGSIGPLVIRARAKLRKILGPRMGLAIPKIVPRKIRTTKPSAASVAVT